MSDDFCHRKEEYLSLRKEIESALSELSALEKNSLLGIAAVYAWLASQDHLAHFFKVVAASAPFFIASFGALRASSIGSHIALIGEYIRRIEVETKPGGPEIVGWETFFINATKGGFQTEVRVGFWVVLAAATFLVWIFSWCAG